jgi:hypothetical protein
MREIQMKLICVLLAACLGGQQQSISPTVDDVQRQVRNYLRDVTELEMTVKSDVIVFDGTRGASKETHSAHRLTYDAGSTPHKTANVQTVGQNRVGDWETHADAGLFATAYAFLPGQGWDGYYHTAPKRVAGSIVVDYSSRERCSAWRRSWFGWHGFKFKVWCGTGNLRVSSDGVPTEASFTAADLAPDLQSSDVPSYTYVVTFQRLSIRNSAKPFIVPREVTLTVTYKNHKVVVHNLYSATLPNQDD